MAEKSDTRLKNIDALKGFIIILVVLGHVLNGYLYGGFSPDDNRLFWSAYNIIYVFHMPMMMTVSGYMFLKAYYHREGKAYVMDKDRYLKHLANLIFVYLLYSLIYGIIKLTVPGYVSNDVTQLDVLKIQRNSLIKEHRERKIAKQDGRTGSGRSGGRARAGLTAGGAQRSLSPEKNRSLNRRIELTEKILKYVFKREHLY